MQTTNTAANNSHSHWSTKSTPVPVSIITSFDTYNGALHKQYNAASNPQVKNKYTENEKNITTTALQ